MNKNIQLDPLHVKQLIMKCDVNLGKLSSLMGISRQTLYNYMKTGKVKSQPYSILVDIFLKTVKF